MHKEILTSEQQELLPLVQQFSKNFFLVGGTAIALYLGHRRSIDFDLFTKKSFENADIKRKISPSEKIDQTIRDEDDQYTVLVRRVQLTFFHYPFSIPTKQSFNRIIKIPDLLTLAAMKAYALGRRAKWKDYVDMFYIMKKAHGMSAIMKRAHKIFGHEFNEKLFREQLSYFEDINYSEKVTYLPGFEVEDRVVRNTLIDFSTR